MKNVIKVMLGVAAIAVILLTGTKEAKADPNYFYIELAEDCDEATVNASNLINVPEYSFDLSTWKSADEEDIDGKKDITLSTASDHRKVYFRAKSGGNYSTISSGTNTFQIPKGKVRIGGDILTLLKAEPGPNQMGDSAFQYLFYGCTGIVDAAQLKLPNYVTDSCYFCMFSDCSNLTVAPNLPATTLANNCYYSMFYETKVSEIHVGFTEVSSAVTDSMLFWLDKTPSGTLYGPQELYDNAMEAIEETRSSDLNEYLSLPDPKYTLDTWTFVIETTDKIQSRAEYNSTQINVRKGTDIGELYLYVKSKDGTLSYKVLSNGKLYNIADINSELTSTDNCKIWLEVKIEDDDLTYARMAEKTSNKFGLVTVGVNDSAMGSANAASAVGVVGEQVKLSVSAKEGYHLNKWETEDVTVSDNQFVMPDKDVSVTAVFAAHLGEKINQVDSTTETYGVREYYKCACGKCYKDADCKEEITDIEAWKAGEGRIEKKAKPSPSPSPSPEPKFEDPTVIFTDVAKGKWYSKIDGPIAYVAAYGIMNGTKDGTTFEPEGDCTREMFVQIIYNMEGKPGAGHSNPFKDVKNGKWYYDAITWAAANDVTKGISADTFGIGGKVTREQLAQFLMNYAKKCGYDTSARADISKFPDSDKISSWAKEAVSWANANGIVNGKVKKGVNYLDPKGNATRAEVAQMMMNFRK